MNVSEDRYEEPKDIFVNLVELDLSYNQIRDEQELMIWCNFVSIQIVDITGNPLLEESGAGWENLRELLEKNLTWFLRTEGVRKDGGKIGKFWLKIWVQIWNLREMSIWRD